MKPRVGDVQKGFAGGLNLVADLPAVREDQVTQAENARLTKYGAIVKRKGVRRLHENALAAAEIQGGYTWERAGAAPLIAVVCDGHLQTGTYASDISWTDVGSGLSASATVSMAAFRDGSGERLYIADGGALNKYDGSSLTADIANSASVSRIWVYNQRLYGLSGTNETLYWSALNNGDSLGYAPSGGGSAAVRSMGDQSLTIGVPLAGLNFLFHITGISVFEGWTQDDINISAGTRGLSSDVGTIAWQAAVAVENGILVPTNHGIYRITPSGVEPESTPIDSVFQELDELALLGTRGVHCHATNEVWFAIPGVGVYVYQLRLKAWAGPWTGTFLDPGVTAMWEGLDGSGRQIVLVGDEDGFVKQADYPALFRDDAAEDGTGGSAYDMVVKCHRFYCGDPAMTKSLRWLYLLADIKGSMGTTVSWVTNAQAGAYTIPNTVPTWGPGGSWGVGIWNATEVIQYDIPAHGAGNRIDVTLTDTGEYEVTFSRVEVEAFALRRG